MIELTPPSLSLIGVEDGGEEDGGGANTAGRIGPSKISTHSLTFSVAGGPGVGLDSGLECGGGIVGVVANIWACLEMEDE